MKPIIFLSILFCVIAIPALAELTDADLDKIRLIVREEIKREIDSVKSELKEDTDRVEKHLKESFFQNIETVNTKIDGTDKQISDTRTWAIGLLALLATLIAVAIGAPYTYTLLMSRRHAKQEAQIASLVEQMIQLRNTAPSHQPAAPDSVLDQGQ